ncbi:MAG TPA: hypothetical protein VG935_04215 [Patescibacteria group bacterium]|nr:hypothetical protein [Patescibacteria group bacterium]
MIIKNLTLLVLLSFLFLGASVLNQALAHVLITDGTIGAVIHIDPEDDPIVGQVASFFFDFKDKTGRFDPKICNCTFKILEAGKEIYSQDLFQNSSQPSLSNASVFYTFPRRDVYTVEVIGHPQTPHAFQDFTLKDDIRVSRTASIPSPAQSSNWLKNNLFYLGILLALVIIIIGGMIRSRFATKKRKEVNYDEEKYS